MTCDNCGRSWVVPIDHPSRPFPVFCDECIALGYRDQWVSDMLKKDAKQAKSHA